MMKKRSSNQSIKFADDGSGKHATVEIDSWRDQSEDERDAQWYSKDELGEFRACDRALMNRQVRGEKLPEDDFSMRGMETKASPEASFAKKTAVLEVIQSILDEQDRQRDMPNKDSQLLADISYELSQDTRRSARRVAMMDSMQIPELAVRIRKEQEQRRKEKELERLRKQQEKEAAAERAQAQSSSSHKRRFAGFFSRRKPNRS